MGLVLSSSDDEGIESIDDAVSNTSSSDFMLSSDDDDELDFSSYIFGLVTSSESELSEDESFLDNKHSAYEGVLFGMGNPLLDITVKVDKEYLAKYKLNANDAILATDFHDELFNEIESKFEPEYFAGGATQNSIKVAQWMLGKPKASTFVGCISTDKHGDLLDEKAQDCGVETNYFRITKESTGRCAALITGNDRSLVASLAAANCYEYSHLEKKENWAYVEKANFYYVAGFFLTVSPESMLAVAKHSSENGKTFCFNLSAPFLCQFFKDPMMKVIPYADIIFCNETEAETFSEQNDLGTKDLKEIASQIANMPKINTNKPRTVVITHGSEPTVVAVGSNEVRSFPVISIKPEDIMDTNGAGDAFVGGYLSQLVKGKSMDACIAGGNWAANLIIQRSGCTFPAKCNFQQ